MFSGGGFLEEDSVEGEKKNKTNKSATRSDSPRSRAAKRVIEGENADQGASLVFDSFGPVTLADTGCQAVSRNGKVCERKDIDKVLQEAFGESVCWSCKAASNSFQLLSRKDCEEYCLSADCFKLLRFSTRRNPHNENWSSMKLYLRKHVELLSIQRYGSQEKLAEERQRRRERSLEKEYQATQLQFKDSLAGLKGSIDGSSKEPLRAKKKSKLMDLVDSIRGK